MTKQPIDFPAITDRICSAVSAAAGRESAMEAAVSELKECCPHYDWVGIYLLSGEYLDLGPFRGEPSPHTHIPLNRGVCGAAAAAKKTINIPDVNADPRYLACSLKTKSEIVVPILDGEVCLGEIDIDSHTPDAFTDWDRIMLECIAGELSKKFRHKRTSEEHTISGTKLGKNSRGHIHGGSMLNDVGAYAGKIYQKLETKGPMSMSRLKKEVGGNETVVTMAIGWLAREGKVKVAKERNSLQIELNGQ